MLPRKMDEDSLLSGRRVHEGEVIGQVGNFHKREGGTSYHLHFDVQVPTRDGWVFVNPYMTLVAAYERLIGGRGEEVMPPVTVATVDPSATGTAAPASIVIEPEQAQAPVAASASARSARRASTPNIKSARNTAWPAVSSTSPKVRAQAAKFSLFSPPPSRIQSQC